MRWPFKRRIKVSLTLDEDAVSPQARKATAACLADMLETAAEKHGAAIDWNRTDFYAEPPRRGEQRFVAKGVVL